MQKVMDLPLTAEQLEEMKEHSRIKLRVKRFATPQSFTSGSSTIELAPSVTEDDWELTSIAVDGANFGDGLTAFCEAFLDRSGLIIGGLTPPFGIRIGAGYFGGYTPFMAPDHPVRLKDGDSIYLCVENGLATTVVAMVEWEIRRI